MRAGCRPGALTWWCVLFFFFFKQDVFFFFFKQEVYLNNKMLDLKGKLSRRWCVDSSRNEASFISCCMVEFQCQVQDMAQHGATWCLGQPLRWRSRDSSGGKANFLVAECILWKGRLTTSPIVSPHAPKSSQITDCHPISTLCGWTSLLYKE